MTSQLLEDVEGAEKVIVWLVPLAIVLRFTEAEEHDKVNR